MQIPLTQAAYQAKSIIADAQRCINLYVENNPKDSPFPFTHYLTPGTNLVCPGPTTNPVRCTFRASNGDFYVVIGDTVYFADPAFVLTSLGTIDAGTTPVSMQDNGLVILICDGTPNLYAVDLATKNFGQVTGSDFFGGDRVDYVDTFFLLNVPGTNEWYISLSEVNFDMLTGVVGSILTGSITDPGDTGAIASGTISNPGEFYEDGTYTNIPFIGGSGSGATIDLIISGGFITQATINQRGINYLVNDVLSIQPSAISVAATGSYTFSTNPTNGQTIILNGVTWTFVTSGATGNQTNIGVNTAATLTALATNLNASTNGQIAVASYTSTPTVLNITYKTKGSVGNSYTLAAGTYSGTISGPTLTGGVTGAGDSFTWTVSAVQGTYTDGTYTNVPLTGGTGTGATANITISGKIITSVTIVNAGTNYIAGDVLSAASATIGGTGTGFVYTVATTGGAAFDPLDIATKNGYPDPIQALIVMHREIWIIGTLTSEIWYDSGAADFAFQILPGTFIEHGCIAKYSICKQDLSVYWISQDEQGQAIILRGVDYQAKRISTNAIENEISQYVTVSDAIGFTYQQEGHTFVVFTFPTANKTWVFDQSNELWHQRTWTDSNGNLNRHRMNCCANAYGMNIVGDWQNGNLYQLDLNIYTDYVDGLGPNLDGSYPISRIRSWPALVTEGVRVSYKKFQADVQVGSDTGIVDNASSLSPPVISLSWSNDRGKTFGNKLEQSIGAIGDYLTTPNWNRLGMGRGRVFELSWSVPGPTALNGAWIEVEKAGS